MNRNCNMSLKTSLVALCLGITLAGCQSGSGTSLPTRKKMPEFTSNDDGFEGPPTFERSAAKTPGEYAFNTQNADFTVNGTSQEFVAISLPDAAADSATVNLLEGLKPFALPLLSGWALQQRHGVAIDLSSHDGGELRRSDFVLEQPNGFSFPLIIMYDRLSEYRLNTIKQLIAEVPSLKLRAIANN